MCPHSSSVNTASAHSHMKLALDFGVLVYAGAGDDASNIGVMLELAHNLMATPADQLPPVPVMFLFSGAEEPLCQVSTPPLKPQHPHTPQPQLIFVRRML